MGRTEGSAVVEGSWATSCPTCEERLVPELLPGETGGVVGLRVVSAEVPIRMVCPACRSAGGEGAAVDQPR